MVMSFGDNVCDMENMPHDDCHDGEDFHKDDDCHYDDDSDDVDNSDGDEKTNTNLFF